MAKIKYTFSDGHTEEIEVTEIFKKEYELIERQSCRNDEKFEWRARKKESSYEKLHEKFGLDIPDDAPTVDEQAISDDFVERFTTVLTEQQRAVFKKVYIENKPLRTVAKELNIRLYAA